MIPPNEIASDWEYDVCLSFAGEQRAYVEQVALRLRREGIRVFYDDHERVSLWGRDLYEYLDWVYQRAARYCVLFASADYARKNWPTHERKSVQARALRDRNVYLLPVRFDDTEIPGLRSTIGYIDLRNTEPDELGELILEKLATRPDRLHFYKWPAAYGGRVWIWILPPARNAGLAHDIQLRWGPWRRSLSVSITENGITLLTSKGAEDVPASCRVEVTPEARVLFGVGDVSGRETLDIEDGWEHA
jgi:hypothetical protein